MIDYAKTTVDELLALHGLTQNRFTSKLSYMAYESGHSAGHYEVMMLFDNFLYEFHTLIKEWETRQINLQSS